MKVCITNVATGPGYIDGQNRLKKSVNTFTDYDTVLFTDEFPPNSPTHKECPYGFKMYALLEAYKRGYDLVFWADSSCVILDDIQPAIDIVKERGYFTTYTSFKVGEWCKDDALKTLEITREEAWNISMIDAGGFVGYDMNHPTTKKIIEMMLEKINDGISFPGPWRKEDGFVSEDPKVRGHRHDMTVFSVIANKLNLTVDKPRTYYIAHNELFNKDKKNGIQHEKSGRFGILWAPGVLDFKGVIEEIGPTWFDKDTYNKIMEGK